MGIRRFVKPGSNTRVLFTKKLRKKVHPTVDFLT